MIKNIKVKKLILIAAFAYLNALTASAPAPTMPPSPQRSSPSATMPATFIATPPATPLKKPIPHKYGQSLDQNTPQHILNTPSSQPTQFNEIMNVNYGAKAFLSFAKADLSAAKTLNNLLARDTITSVSQLANILFFAQQAAEKALKSYLFLVDDFASTYERIHDLEKLATHLATVNPGQPSFTAYAKVLNPYQNSPRYPDVALPENLKNVDEQMNKAHASEDVLLIQQAQKAAKDIADTAVEYAQEIVERADLELATPGKNKRPALHRFPVLKNDPIRTHAITSLQFDSSDDDAPSASAMSPQSPPQSSPTSSVVSPVDTSSSPRPLSTSPNKQLLKQKNELYKKWINSAHDDMNAAHVLLRAAKHFQATTNEGNILTLAQQSVEKSLKALWIALNMGPLKPTHDIKKLATSIAKIQAQKIMIQQDKLAKSMQQKSGARSITPPTKKVLRDEDIFNLVDKEMQNVITQSDALEELYLKTRYPSEQKIALKLTPQQAIDIAQEIADYVERHVEPFNRVSGKTSP